MANAWYRNTYLQSAEWLNFRDSARHQLVIKRCGLCNSKTEPLDAHHCNYRHLHDVKAWDMAFLCRTCHRRVHGLLELIPELKKFKRWHILRIYARVFLLPGYVDDGASHAFNNLRAKIDLAKSEHHLIIAAEEWAKWKNRVEMRDHFRRTGKFIDWIKIRTDLHIRVARSMWRARRAQRPKESDKRKTFKKNRFTCKEDRIKHKLAAALGQLSQ